MQHNLFDLTPHAVQRPEKVSWFFPIHAPDILSAVKSKSLRGFLRKRGDVMTQAHLTQECKKLDAAAFEAWLPYYTAKMNEQGYELLATPQWYVHKCEEEKDVYLISISQEAQVVATLVFTFAPHTHRSSIAFRANDRIELPAGGRSSVGALLDYAFLEWSKEQACTAISAGRSRNAFGVINTVGNLEYKLRFGYQPQVSAGTEQHDSVPLSPEGFVYFYGLSQTGPGIYRVSGGEQLPRTEVQQYTTLELPFREITY